MKARCCWLRRCCVVTGLLFALWVSPVCASWQITRFVAYEGRPVDQPGWSEDWDRQNGPTYEPDLYDEFGDLLNLPRGWRLEEEGREVQAYDPALLREIEKFLSAAANEFSKLGFVDPVATGWLDSIVKDDNRQDAIRFYLYEIPGVSAPFAFYSSGKPCSSPSTSRKVININTLKFAPNGRATGTDWATLAHELFHAVQSASTFHRDSCGPALWISEGTADAIAHDLTRQIKGVDFRNELQPGSNLLLKVYGGRKYGHPLEQHILGVSASDSQKGDHGYLTSSFWRYLAELDYVKTNNPSGQFPTSRPAEGVDYRYLVRMFKRPWNVGRNPAGELRWVNEALKKEPHFKSSLAVIYARFIAAFSDYGEARIEKDRLALTPPVSGPTTDQWLAQIFTACEQAGAFGSGDAAEVTIRLMPNAAGCIEAEHPAGHNLKTPSVVIQATNNDRNLLRQLRIGLLDGTLDSAPAIYSFMEDQPPYIARWTFPLFGDTRGIYIVSNMAAQPDNTKLFVPELFFSVGEWDSSMWQGPLRPPQPPPSGQPLKREMQEERLKKAMTDPVSNLAPVVKVERKLWSHPCDSIEQRFNLCSAKMVITLAYAPWIPTDNLLEDSFVITDMLNESVADGPAGIGVPNGQLQAGRETEEFLQSIDASKIRIELPKVEYGFTGTFSNASIRVSKAGAGAYLSYGPTLDVGQRRIHQPPNGSVTINEYSHLVLRGTFRADLIDLNNPGNDNSPIVAQTISGSFIIPSPYLLDDDFSIDEEYFKQELIQNMMLNSPFGTGIMDSIIQSNGGAPPQILCDEGVDEAFLEVMGFTSGCGGESGAQTLKTCSCDCELRLQEANTCKRACYQPWKDCRMPDSEIPEDLEMQVAYCKERLIRKGVPDNMLEMTLGIFRQAPDIQRKEMLKQSWCGD